jgi:hypothetical protein
MSLALTPVSPGALTTADIVDALPSSYGRAVFGRAFFGWVGRITGLTATAPGGLSTAAVAVGAIAPVFAPAPGVFALPREDPDPLSIGAAGTGALPLTPRP